MEIVSKNVSWCTSLLPYPCFRIKLLEGANPGLYAEDVERYAIDIIGLCTESKLSSTRRTVEHEFRLTTYLMNLVSMLCLARSLARLQSGCEKSV